MKSFQDGNGVVNFFEFAQWAGPRLGAFAVIYWWYFDGGGGSDGQLMSVITTCLLEMREHSLCLSLYLSVHFCEYLINSNSRHVKMTLNSFCRFQPVTSF